MPAQRSATVKWEGGLASGSGNVTTSTSGALDELNVSWKTRTEEAGGPAFTSPEELIAAAHASCFAMSLSHVLEGASYAIEELDVSVTVTFDKRGDKWTIVKSAIDVVGDVSGIDEATFARLANEAKRDCPVSRALANNVELTVSASLAAAPLAASAGP